jgi:hypothetical protein
MSAGRAAVDRLGSAFLSGDVAEVLAEFAGSGDVLYAGSEPGEVAVGRTDLRSLLEELLSRDERYSWEAGAVHEVGAGVLLCVVAEAELTVHVRGPGGWSAAERLPYRVSGVLERDAGSADPSRWLWRACQGSEPVTASS